MPGTNMAPPMDIPVPATAVQARRYKSRSSAYGRLGWLTLGIVLGALSGAGATNYLLTRPPRAPLPAAPVSLPPSGQVRPPIPAPAITPPARPLARPAAPVPVRVPAFDLPIRLATVDEIDARRDRGSAMFRLAEDTAVLVADFADLHTQALMLNRVAALIEKADMPRNRVVSEAELDSRIRAAGGDPDLYYVGHDYRAADLARFFRLAASQGMPLNPEESWLQGLIEREGWMQAGAVGALISIVAVGGPVDGPTRTTVLRHELSHAVYFTDPAYAKLTHHFWNEMLNAKERAELRQFLGHEGYDTKDEDLMANEGQAYLIHTRDPRFFTPAMVKMSNARAAALRKAFIAAIPEPWLKASAEAVEPEAPRGVTVPAASRRTYPHRRRHTAHAEVRPRRYRHEKRRVGAHAG